MVIRTPDQRLRVFVSPTVGEQSELANERRAVARAIRSLRLTPVLFELGARPHPPQELYRAYLAQSDVFIGLYWQRYGRTVPGLEVSGLEEELRLARDGALPRLLYVKAPAPDREPGWPSCWPASRGKARTPTGTSAPQGSWAGRRPSTRSPACSPGQRSAW
jgi:hypothetical protein